MSTVFLLRTLIPTCNVYILRRTQPACAPERTLNSNFRFKLSVPQNTVPSDDTEGTVNSKRRFKLNVPQNTVPSADNEGTVNSKRRFKLSLPQNTVPSPGTWLFVSERQQYTTYATYMGNGPRQSSMSLLLYVSQVIHNPCLHFLYLSSSMFCYRALRWNYYLLSKCSNIK